MAAAVVVLAVAGVLFLLNRERPYDPGLDTQVSEPAYRGGGPLVLYDEGHLNTHTAGGGYKPLADLIRNDGYNLRVTRQPISAVAAALRVATRLGPNETVVTVAVDSGMKYLSTALYAHT